MLTLLKIVVLFSELHSFSSWWISRATINHLLNDFLEIEKFRHPRKVRNKNRISSSPLITGDGFRENFIDHLCDETNGCKLDPSLIQEGDVVFVFSDFLPKFVKEYVPLIPYSYSILAHNADVSSPDGQDYPRDIRMGIFVTSNILENEYENDRLIAFFGTNLWWNASKVNATKPSYYHCIPLGLENRHYKGFGYNISNYFLKSLELNRPNFDPQFLSNRPLLLVAFERDKLKPDRKKLLDALGIDTRHRNKHVGLSHVPGATSTWYNFSSKLSHEQWLEAITLHRFVVVPFGRGLDTHRMSEILLMGGVPVMRKSTISSCYDDSDNHITLSVTNISSSREKSVGGGLNNMSRGSLPVVFIDRWEDLNQSRLEAEWSRIVTRPLEDWDWKRLTLDHWVNRIRGMASRSLRRGD